MNVQNLVDELPKTAQISGKKSDTKRITVDKNIGNLLIDAANNQNSKISKSIIIDESLKLSGVIDYDDNIKSIESNLNNKLEKAGVEVEEINQYSTGYTYDDIESAYNHVGKKRMEIRLTEDTFINAGFKRGWGTKISEAVEYVVGSVHNSRTERIEIKMNIVDIINGENLDNYDDLTQNIYEDVVDDSIFSRFDEFGFYELKENSELFTTVDDKHEALYEVYNTIKNNNVDIGRNKLQTMFISAFDYSNEYHGKKLFNKFCEDYGLYEYENFTGTDITIDYMDTILNDLKAHEDINYVISSLIKAYARSVDNKFYFKDLAGVLYNHNIIESEEPKECRRFLQTLSENYDTGINKIKHGQIHVE